MCLPRKADISVVHIWSRAETVVDDKQTVLNVSASFVPVEDRHIVKNRTIFLFYVSAPKCKDKVFQT